jgi:hypothetical protein
LTKIDPLEDLAVSFELSREETLSSKLFVFRDRWLNSDRGVRIMTGDGEFSGVVAERDAGEIIAKQLCLDRSIFRGWSAKRVALVTAALIGEESTAMVMSKDSCRIF